MRFRLLLSTLAVCLLVALASALIVQAQTQSLNERNAFWESRTVIGSPEDDEGDDEGDDDAMVVQRISVATVEQGLSSAFPPGTYFACVSAGCAAGEIAISGGFTTLHHPTDEAYIPPSGSVNPCAIFACGFEVLYNGPGPPRREQVGNGRNPSPHEWSVCGQSPEELVLRVYAICTSARLPICGDGRVGSGEECETDDDCGGGTCDDCLCSGYCGDGVFDPLTEGCETDGDCPYHPMDDYFCRDCSCIVHGEGD